MVSGELVAQDLRCEYAVEPLGVDAEQPVLGWVPVASRGDESQLAYRVIVASDPALLSGIPDMWDSGRVESDLVNGVAYAGTALSSRTRCWWAVQLWDRDNRAGPFSRAAAFEMGLLRSTDWQAKWIGSHVPGIAPLLRQEFLIPDDVRRARAYVTGLGYYELRFNGAKVGDRVLDPATTTYDHDPQLCDAAGRPTRICSPRVLYSVFDVTGQLRPGRNVVGLILGNGWYSLDAWTYRPWGDRPRGLVQIEIEVEGGERLVVASDGNWRETAGPFRYDNPIHGEYYDARLEQDGWDEVGIDDSGWRPAAVLTAPGGQLRSQLLEPIRVIETLAPKSVTALRKGVQVIDFGQHISGWTRLTVSGSAGSEVILRHAGEVGDKGELDDRANMTELLPARQTDVYTLRGAETEIWEPRFTLHGFRYVELTTSGDLHVERVQACVVHSDVAETGQFHCANELLNRIDENVRWTYRASLQGYPQDAADRAERVGWLGDPGWIIEDYLYNFDTLAFWAKWLDDIRDAQLPDGALPVAAPIHWPESYKDWPDWATTYPLIVWHLYFFYGDRSILTRHYDGLRRLLDWFSSFAADHVVDAGLGDHMEPQPDGTCHVSPLRTPVALTSTAWLYSTAEIVAEIAELLGDQGSAASARALATSVREAFNARFYDTGTGRYATGSQSAMAMSLWLGLVPIEHRAKVAANLVEEIRDRDRGHPATGAMGTPALEQVLADVGAAEVMYEIASQTEFPSWGDQIRQGATTVWESWGHEWTMKSENGSVRRLVGSRNMKLLAAISKFLYKDVAGLSPTEPGWRRMCVKPRLPHRLDHAKARVRTVRGEAAVAWRKETSRLIVELQVPDTSRAEVWLPIRGITDLRVWEGADMLWGDDRPCTKQARLRNVRRVGDHLCLEAGGGTYKFTLADAAAADRGDESLMGTERT